MTNYRKVQNQRDPHHDTMPLVIVDTNSHRDVASCCYFIDGMAIEDHHDEAGTG